jgi:hypothetical protein
MSINDKERMHEYIRARADKMRYAGTERGDLAAQRMEELLDEMSPVAQVQVKLEVPDENVGD